MYIYIYIYILSNSILPVYTHNIIWFLTHFFSRKRKNFNEFCLHAPVCRDLFHTLCLISLNVIFQVTKTQGQLSSESLCNVRAVVYLLSSEVGRNVFSSDSIILLLLKTNSYNLFIYYLNCMKNGGINLTMSYFIRYHHHNYHYHHHQHTFRPRLIVPSKVFHIVFLYSVYNLYFTII